MPQKLKVEIAGYGVVGKRRRSVIDPHILLLDSSLARDKLGWTPRFDIDESLDLTEEWYSAHRLGGAKQELRALAEGQIDRYLEASNGNRGDD